METLLTRVRTALRDPEYFLLEERVNKSIPDDKSKVIQSVEFAIAPIVGISKIKANEYWIEKGKNIGGKNYCWGHWRCQELDRLNFRLQGIFSSLIQKDSPQRYFNQDYAEGKGYSFQFHEGELRPVEDGLVKELDFVSGWFKGKGQPDTLILPYAEAEEFVGVTVKKKSEQHRIFQSYRSEVEAPKNVTYESKSGIERRITVLCYPSREFYERQKRIFRRRDSLFGKGTGVDIIREKEKKYIRQLESLGLDLEVEGLKAIDIQRYNEYFKDRA